MPDNLPNIDNIPEEWPTDLWQACWDEENQRWDITNSEWMKLENRQQFILSCQYQKWYSHKFSLPLEKIIEIPGKEENLIENSEICSQKIVLRLIPPGEFWMGSPEDEVGHNYTELQHPVAITHPYYIGKYLITQGQWKAVTGFNPSKFHEAGLNCPVEQVDWLDCQEFCRKLKGISQISSECNFQIPTEAEWEYSCRSGVTSQYFWAGTPEEFDQYGWDKNNSDQQTHPVGQKLPNAWELYDIAGLVWQWCRDVKAYYYLDTLLEDPCNQDGYGRIIRGGSWRLPAKHFRSAIQIVREPDFNDAYLGFRIVLENN